MQSAKNITAVHYLFWDITIYIPPFQFSVELSIFSVTLLQVLAEAFVDADTESYQKLCADVAFEMKLS